MAEVKVALVTGANKGIGFETARGLVREGYRTWLGCRDADRGEDAAARLREEGGDARALALDVADGASIQAAAATLAAAESRLDALVNNAGITMQDDAGSTSSEAVMRQVFEVNLFGAVAVINAFLPLLRRSPAGRIVNVTSGVGSLATMSDPLFRSLDVVAYAASKAALNMVTVQFAKALADSPIKINSGDPGLCATDMSGARATRSAAQGAVVMVRLATLPADGPTGGFFEDLGPVPW
jgi:NAD(P)-dependent dehydrogenase (short-subunit alcohol dehydrogenase family)